MATNVKRKKKAEVMPDDGNMTLTGHLKELRNRLIVCAVVFVAAVVVTLAYADRLIDLLTAMGQGFYTFVSIAPQEKLMQYFRVSCWRLWSSQCLWRCIRCMPLQSPA